jgi:hypothetical protein
VCALASDGYDVGETLLTDGVGELDCPNVLQIPALPKAFPWRVVWLTEASTYDVFMRDTKADSNGTQALSPVISDNKCSEITPPSEVQCQLSTTSMFDPVPETTMVIAHPPPWQRDLGFRVAAR